MFTLGTYNINKMAAKFTVLVSLILLTSCSYLPHVLYKIDVQQGNVVTEDMLEKLKPGMTKSQVLFVLGSPLIVDAFRDNRWDYVYVFRKKGDLTEQKRLTLYFDNDTLINIENHLDFSEDSGKPQAAKAGSKPEEAETNPGEEHRSSENTGFWHKLKTSIGIK